MKNISHLKALKAGLNMIKAEVEPDLDIPELSKISRAEMIELIDWELKRVAKAQKMFGVTAWALLVGFAAVSWAFMSMPNLANISIVQGLWAFFLLESVLILGETLWSFVNRPANLISESVLRFSTLGGVSTKPTVAVTALRFLTLFVVSFTLPTLVPAEIVFVTRLIIIFVLLFLAGIFVLLKCGIPIVPEKRESELKMGASALAGIMIFCVIIGPSFVLPTIVWGWAFTFKCLPEMESFRLAGLLVAAGYLLRMLLVANAQAHHQPFLEQLHRYVVLGFLTPEKAALQLCWRVSDLPQDVYVNGRLRALTSELLKLEANMRANILNVSNAANHFKQLPKEKQALDINTLTQWLEQCMNVQIAQSMGPYVKIRGSAFMVSVLSKNKWKGTKAYLEWEAACQAVDVVGKEYVKVRADLDSLVQQNRADNTNATPKNG